MSAADRAAELERRAEVQKKDAFTKWQDEPMVRMGLSMIPSGDHQDALKMLLQSAFNAGFSAGSGNMLSTVVEALIKKQGPS